MPRSLMALSFLATLAGSAPAQDAPAEYIDLAYGDHARQNLDLTVPVSDKPLPLLIWVHGGGWEGGDKGGRNPARLFLDKGYAVASVNYRYSKQAVFPAQYHDCQAAVRYLRTNAKKYNLDPDAFGAWGASAGGHLVALLGTAADVPELDGDPKSKVSPKVQAVFDWFGPTDLTKLSPTQAKDNPITRLLGGPTGETKELAVKGNPITHVSKGDAPFLIAHGTTDRLVPLSQSELLQAALKKSGIESEMMVFDGAGHGDGEFAKQATAPANREKVTAFFAKHLKGAKAK